jgi:CRISPR/Cas system-associated exonuclease Cas4 (RecB family)
MLKFAPYSFSRISTHKQCPRKFKYSYVDDVKVPFVYSEPLMKGGAVHHILEHHPELSTHKHQAKYQHIADKFLETDLAREIMMYERKVELDIGLTAELKPCAYGSKEAMFRGSIDCMFYNETTKTMVLVDWKTGKLREPKWQSFDQLMYYAIYMFIKYPKLNNIMISYVFVEHENAENNMSLARQYLRNYVTQLMGDIGAVEADIDYPKNATKLCDYCDYKSHCDADF